MRIDFWWLEPGQAYRVKRPECFHDLDQFTLGQKRAGTYQVLGKEGPIEVPEKLLLKAEALGYIVPLPTVWDHIRSV